jgi:hypothetical protein
MRIRWKAIALAVAATAIAAEPSAAQPFAYVLQPGVSFCGIRNIAPCLPHLWTIDIENGRIIHREEGPLGSGWRGPLALTGTGRLLAWSGGLVDRAQMNLQALSGDPEQSVHAGPQVNRLFALIPSAQILRVVDVGGEAFDISLNAAGARRNHRHASSRLECHTRLLAKCIAVMDQRQRSVGGAHQSD